MGVVNIFPKNKMENILRLVGDMRRKAGERRFGNETVMDFVKSTFNWRSFPGAENYVEEGIIIPENAGYRKNHNESFEPSDLLLEKI